MGEFKWGGRGGEKPSLKEKKQANERGHYNRDSEEKKKKQKGGYLPEMQQDLRRKIIDSLTSYPGPKHKTAQKYIHTYLHNILHIDKSQAMWIDTGTVYTKGG